MAAWHPQQTQGVAKLFAAAFDLQPLGTSGLLALAALAALAALLPACVLIAVVRRRAARQVQAQVQALESANARLRLANESLLQQAHVDALTGLPNRLMFDHRLNQASARLERAAAPGRAQEKLAVLCLDLDRLGAVNESMGVAAGDLVLKEAARRIRAMARESDTVARDGSDSFLVLMEGVAGAQDCVALAERVIGALSMPFETGGRPLAISASVGVAVYPDHGQRDELVPRADMAMHTAKRAGGSTCAIFSATEERSALEQLALQNDLRDAAELGQLLLHYQPKIDARRGVIRGVEALLRWVHPQRGMVSPAVFIPIAERSGLIHQLGHWVIEESCRQMRAWADAGLRIRVAINVSAHQLRRDDFVASIEQALRRHQIDPSQLLCEITESILMEDVEHTRRVLEGLGRLGVYLSIDDFGTGYSSLSYLRQLPAQQLKIDRSFVKDLESSTDARAIVDAVVRLAHALGLRVVAEGVETAGQRDALLQLDCDELQGYFFARPMPATALEDWACGSKPEGCVDFSPSVIDEAHGAQRQPLMRSA